jgi:tRNA A-37 threonylcarbamoyl transferase component Bud32
VATRVGTHLDRYEIEAELGRGAMGVVYRARDPKLGRTVAIKTVSISGLELDAEREYRARFVIEAQAAGRLSHPGIVTIFDVREEAEPYLVMEYIEGQSLQKLLTRENRTLPLSTTLRLIQEIADALHYAHAQGVVHRDIKPANILVTPDGHPKIADFGIAKLNQTDSTLPGRVLGSPAYMAPEQLSDETVDARSDLFSLGVILYYMLTGHRPFQGNSTTTVCFKLVNHEPLPVSAFESKFPPELDAIVSRAIAKDPVQRYQSGMAMASDIQRLRERSGFIHDKVEWTAHSLKRDAIPSYVRACAEPGSMESGGSRLQAVGFTAGSGIGDTRTIHAPGIRFSNTGLALGLLAIAVGFLAFWDIHTGRQKPDGPGPTTPPVEVSREYDAGGAKDEAVAKSPELQRKLAIPHANVSTHEKVPIVSVPANAVLQIDIEHHFMTGLASVWVDNRLVYTQALHGDEQRHALLLRKVVGHQFKAITVAPGKHRVRVRVQSVPDSYDQSNTIADAFIRGASTLRVICGKKRDPLQLALQKETYQ